MNFVVYVLDEQKPLMDCGDKNLFVSLSTLLIEMDRCFKALLSTRTHTLILTLNSHCFTTVFFFVK